MTEQTDLGALLRSDAFTQSGTAQFLIRIEAGPRYVFEGLNQAHTDITGIRSEDLRGKEPHQFLPPRLADTVVQNYADCYARNSPTTYDEVLELPSGKIWFRTTLSPIRDGAGCVYGILGQATAISDLKAQLFEQAVKSTRIEKVADDLSNLLPLISHDFRGPLGSIDTALEQVLDGFVDIGDGKQALLSSIRETTAELRTQFEGLLQYCSALAIEDQVTHENIDFGHICRDQIALTDPDNTLDINYDDCHIRAELAPVQIALRNLIANARRFASTSMQIGIEALDDQLILTVADDGPGMGQAQLARVLKPRLDHQGLNGSGFGLRAVDHLARRDAGSLDIIGRGILGGLEVRFAFSGQLICRVRRTAQARQLTPPAA